MAKKNAAAAVVENNAAANNNNTNNVNNAAAAKTERAPLSPLEIAETSAALIREFVTISNIRANYATLVDKYGKDNFAAILKDAKTLRSREIENAHGILMDNVFSYSGILSAVFAAVAKDNGYKALCAFAKREYNTTDNAAAARAVIKDYFSAVDENGAPLCREHYVNNNGVEIYAVYVPKKLTYTSALTILKSSFDGMKSAATNAATRANGNDNAAAIRHNVKTPRAVVAVYAAAKDAAGIVTRGARLDTSKDDATRNAAAAVIGKILDTSKYLTLKDWNADNAAADTNAAAVAE